MDSETENSPDREQLLADAVARFIDLLAREETVDLDSFCRDYPNLEPDLRWELETLLHIERILQPAESLDSLDGAREEIPERLSGHKILDRIGRDGVCLPCRG